MLTNKKKLDKNHQTRIFNQCIIEQIHITDKSDDYKLWLLLGMPFCCLVDKTLLYTFEIFSLVSFYYQWISLLQLSQADIAKNFLFHSSCCYVLTTEEYWRDSYTLIACQINILQVLNMPIPIEKIQVVQDEIEREHEAKTDDDDDDYDDLKYRHTTAMTPPDQDFSFLQNSSNAKRSVHYDIELNNNQENRPLRINYETEQSTDNGLRRRYIAHWGLPGKL